MFSRRNLIGSAALLIGAGAVSGRAQAAGIPEAAQATSAATQAPLLPATGQDYQPVVTLNGWTLPWRMNGEWKEYHLVAEPVEREIAPGMTARLWGYNGQSPGPTIEAVEGDKVRIFVTNKLAEHTTVHWHGMPVPNGMDGVGGLTQPHIEPGKTFVYEFLLKRSGTFMYHPHSDEMVQMAMGMMGLFIVHPRDPSTHRVDRDFVFIMSTYDIDPGSSQPKVMTMTDFDLWTWNSRVFPGIDPLIVRRGDRVRVRIGNLTMTNHPIHLHGYCFQVTCTDGGWIPASARLPEVTTDVPVGAMRAFEFVADEPGDWAIHCHKAHHTMNAMGHDVKTLLGARERDLRPAISKLVPGYMAMGGSGMAEMGRMQMQLPDNTLPMMTGFGQYGPLEMGGMFSVVKVRDGIAADDYRDPGPYRHPEGTVAREVEGAADEPVRRSESVAGQPGHQGEGGQAGHVKTDATPLKENIMKKIVTALFACALLGSQALAQSALIEGQVVKVDPSAGSITIKHGPIRKLDMDQAMTMVFHAQSADLLKGVKAGDKIKFDAESVNGQYTVTKIEKSK